MPWLLWFALKFILLSQNENYDNFGGGKIGNFGVLSFILPRFTFVGIALFSSPLLPSLSPAGSKFT